MSFVAFFIPLLFQLLLFTQNAQLQPTFSSQPSNPTTVEEDGDLILQWNFNLDGQSNFLSRILNVTAGALQNVAIRENDDNATVEAGYENLFRATITDTQATLTILAVPKSINGEIYQMRVLTASPHFITLQSDVKISVLFKAENVQLAVSDSSICEGDVLNLSCSADGNPPVHTYLLFENDTLLNTSGSSVVTRTASAGGVLVYRCEANNTVGTANATTTVTVNEASVIQALINITVIEGENSTLPCHVSGIPLSSVSWTEVRTGDRTEGNIRSLINVNRSDAGEYKCEASNFCGNDSKSTFVIVNFMPEDVQLTTNVTANKACLNDVVFFNCSAANANPAVALYQFFENDVLFGSSSLGMFSKMVMNSGNLTYKCVANNTAGTTSSQHVTITVNVPASIQSIEDQFVIERRNTSVICNASETPQPTVFWIVASGQRTNSSVLEFTNISRSESGEYRCEASNECGSAVEAVNVTVQYPPENVLLTINAATNKACQSDVVSFTCSADAVPSAMSFQLFKDNVPMEISASGMWVKTLSEGGMFHYKCVANNSIGSASSASVNITVNVPASIQSIEDQFVIERRNTSVICNASETPQPTVFWIDVASGQRTNSSVLEFTNISRSEAGEYRCEASNECGSAVEAVNVTVQYRPSSSAITTIPSNTTVLRGSNLSFTCTTDANPPADMYHFYFKGRLIESNSSGVFNRTVEDDGLFTCVPINTVGTGENATVNVTVVDAPLVEINEKADTVVEGKSITLYCNATGKPDPTLTWTKVGNARPLSNNSVLNTGILNRNDTINNIIQYQCTASNGVESIAKAVANITVHYRPSASTLTAMPANTTVLRGSTLSLDCNTDANPAANMFFFYYNGNPIGNNPSGVLNHSVQDDGVYMCVPFNDVGAGDNATISVIVVDGPQVEINKTADTVEEGESITLYCNATGKPDPTLTWTKVGSLEALSHNAVLNTGILNRNDTINNITQYQCTASNGVESPAKAVANISVLYPPKIIIPSNNTIEVEYQFDVKCEADGNPMPTYVWRNTTGGVIAEKSSFKATEDGNYTCFATNSIKTVNRSISITVKYDDFFLAMTIEELEYITDFGDPNSQAAQDLREQVVIEINKLHEHVRYFDRTEVTGFSEGSVVVSFVVYFNTPVTTVGGLATLQNAVDSGKLGQFKVRRGSLNILDRENRVTTTPIVSTTESTAVTSTISNKKGDLTDGPPWPIIGGAIGAVVVVIIIILIVACWVHKKRKCRKDTKIHNSESEVLQGQNDIEDGVHAQVNGGYGGRYADAGPPSANGTNRFVQPQPEQQQQQQAGVTPPDYAVVDKSKKKNKDSNNGNENIPDHAVGDKSKKKKNKKAEAEDPYAEVEDPKKDKDKKTAEPSTHDYAVVNKSKKKKKEEDENAYATVDKSKKSKKKPKAPGEVLYADLDDFKPVQAPSMPTVSTSPEPLAPLKRPTSYQATEYADITQFLRGNATLPEGQSTEMQPTYANAGGGQGAAANKENTNTGGKGGGGGDAEPKETPM